MMSTAMDEWTNIGGAIDMKVVFTLVVITILICHCISVIILVIIIVVVIILILIIIILHVKVYTEPMEDGPINLANNKCEHHAPKVDSNSNEVALTLCWFRVPPTFMGKMHEVKQSCICRIRTELERMMIEGNDGLNKKQTFIPSTSSGINNRDSGRLDSNLGKGDPELDSFLGNS